MGKETVVRGRRLLFQSLVETTKYYLDSVMIAFDFFLLLINRPALFLAGLIFLDYTFVCKF